MLLGDDGHDMGRRPCREAGEVRGRRRAGGGCEKGRADADDRRAGAVPGSSVGVSPCADGGMSSDPFDENALRGMVGAFRADRLERGPCVVDAEWVDGPLDRWLDALADGSALDPRDAAVLAVMMSETLAVRDVLIVSLVCGSEDGQALKDMAANPQHPTNVLRMTALLSLFFDDPARSPDVARCARGMAMLADMASRVPADLSIQPRAVIAYTEWWMGDPHAARDAELIRRDDPDCTLASIVLAAAARGILPAWCRTASSTAGARSGTAGTYEEDGVRGDIPEGADETSRASKEPDGTERPTR